MTTIQYHTKEEAIQAVNKNGYDLGFCTPELQDNEDVVMTAIKQNSWAIEYASKTLKSNKAFIMKAINEGASPWGLVSKHTSIILKSDIEIMSLALEKSTAGGLFCYAQGEAAINKELAAKALVKWGKFYGSKDFDIWNDLHHTLKEFFPRDGFYEKAQSYLHQLEQEKQAEMISGGSTAEDELVW